MVREAAEPRVVARADPRVSVETNVRIHRRLCSTASALCRTSDQGIPADSPTATRRARRSISDAQAAATSAGLSVSVASRLANSPAAMSARSAIGNVSAWRRSFSDREVMPYFTSGSDGRSRNGTRDRADTRVNADTVIAVQIPSVIRLQNALRSARRSPSPGRRSSIHIRRATFTCQRHASRGVNDPTYSGAGPPRARGTGVVHTTAC